MRLTTNLYCDILGYDAMQFDMYILTFPRKKFFHKIMVRKGK